MIGFSIAAPVGPIGVLVIRRTLARGRAFGLVSGLGAASADAVYGCIAAFGLTAISNLLIAQQDWLRIFGGAFLLYLGIRTLLSKPANPDVEVTEGETGQALGFLGAYGSIFLLTITNPLTILSFAAVFASLGTGTDGALGGAVTVVLGVFAGSALWWLTLSVGVSLLRRWVNASILVWVNRASGLILASAGLLAIGSVFL